MMIGKFDVKIDLFSRHPNRGNLTQRELLFDNLDMHLPLATS
jgi:hypothetical protein